MIDLLRVSQPGTNLTARRPHWLLELALMSSGAHHFTFGVIEFLVANVSGFDTREERFALLCL